MAIIEENRKNFIQNSVVIPILNGMEISLATNETIFKKNFVI